MKAIAKKHQAIILVLLGAVMISFSAVWVKIVDVPPTSSAFYRALFGGIFLIFPVILTEKLQRPRAIDIALITTCGLAFALDLFFWHKSILYIGPGLATIIGNFQVFIMAGVGIFFFKEKILPRFFFSIPLALLGLAFIVGNSWQELGSDYKTGVLYGFFTALSYSVFLLTLRKLQIRKSPFYSTLMAISLTCGIFLLPVLAIENVSLAIPNLQSLISLVCLGLFSQSVGWSLIAYAMPRIPASITGLVLLLQPSLSFVWDILFFKRPTDPGNLLGVCLTLGAIYLGMTSKKKTPKA
ncbi:DMT family transporter [Desulfotalea psychrophila]|uniref:Conserved hypothetical membrane protein n=1 Tax=Desulfotalea psychrophila (strain LSv54 / DSM 12343) TaxID=177439 RepID=Q6AQU2_DESPS|nr:DMT family transporter [Desulfotalea psychrophila]CAG35281.1 conserved hypothetical membrane protein [Desulfotalea psychrophila LSv54]